MRRTPDCNQAFRKRCRRGGWVGRTPCRALAAGLVVFSLIGAAEAEPPQTQWRGNDTRSPRSGPWFAVAHTSSGWANIWESLGYTAPSGFEDGRDMAVLLKAGRRPTGGYALELVSMAPTGLFLTVRWRERRPPDGALVTQVLTYPWLIEKTAKSDLPVLFQEVGHNNVSLPRLEYFAFKTRFPQCAAGIDGSLPAGTSVFVLPASVVAPFLADRPKCAQGK